MVARVAAQHDVHSLINFPHYITYCTMVAMVAAQHDVHSLINFPHYITYCTMVARVAAQHDVHSLIKFPTLHYLLYYGGKGCCTAWRSIIDQISHTTGNCDSEEDI